MLISPSVTSSTMKIRLLLADHDRRTRALLRSHLNGDVGIEIVAEVGNSGDLLAATRDLKPDVVLIDETMPALAQVEPRLGHVFGGRTIVWTADDHGELYVRPLLSMPHRAPQAVGNIGDFAVIVRGVVSGEITLDGAAATKATTRVNALASYAETSAALALAREALTVQMAALEDKSAQFEFAREALGVRFEEMQQMYRSTVRALASSVELRDSYTGGHIERVCNYATALSRALDTSLMAEELVFGYVLHDIGKLAIPDSILLKPGALTEREREIVKTHTTEGARLISEVPFLHAALPLVRNHHERYDGRGYPDGLAGNEIPLVARVFTLADTLDAMTTDRPYRTAMTLERSVEELRKGAGSQFDPNVVAVFTEVVAIDEAFAGLRAGVVPGRARTSSDKLQLTA